MTKATDQDREKDGRRLPPELLGPLPCRPCPVRCVWGSDRLSGRRGLPGTWGTSWEVSAHPNGESTATVGGEELGLGEVLARWGDAALGEGPMLRAGYLDTNEPLSVQVHPNEAYARAHAHDHGKTETWYILEAEPGATLVAGTRATTTAELARALDAGTVGDLLVTHPVAKGDVVHIPAGCLHALGAGILAAEVGGDSDTTYRFWDYDRVDDSGRRRPLHREDGLAVVDPDLEPTIVRAADVPRGRPVITSPGYEVELLEVGTSLVMESAPTVRVAMVVAGEGTVTGPSGKIALSTYDSLLVPASAGPMEWRGPMELLVARAKETVQATG